MNAKKKSRTPRLYNVLFPLWMLLLLPQLWIVVIPGNFLIDSLILLISLAALKIPEKKQWYKDHILKIFGFGMLADIIGAAFMLLLMLLGVSGMGDEPLMTIPALLISAVLIFVFNYFVTFKKVDKALRFKLALIFAPVRTETAKGGKRPLLQSHPKKRGGQAPPFANLSIRLNSIDHLLHDGGSLKRTIPQACFLIIGMHGQTVLQERLFKHGLR